MKPWTEVAHHFTGNAVAHLATLNEDGAPHVVPVWIDRHGESDLVFFTIENTRKDHNVTRDPRVAISTTNPSNPLDMATVRGEVVERIGGEDGMAVVDRISRAYTGEDYDIRDGLVAFVVRPTTWTSRDYSGE